MPTPILNEDIIYDIIKELLVNKHWNKVAASLLWINPFQFRNNDSQKYLIIRTIFPCFNKEERNITNSILKRDLDSLNDYKYQTPFFEYGKYLKEFRPRELDWATDVWFGFIKENYDRNIKDKHKFKMRLL